MPEPGKLPSVARRGPLAMAAGGALAGAPEIRALQPQSRFVLRLGADVLAGHPQLAGFRLDLPINRFAAGDGRTSARLGPDEWLLIGPESEGDAILAEAGARLAGAHHAFTDISHRNFGLEISGPRAADMVNAACALDLDVRSFPTGQATRTLFGKAEIVLMRCSDAPTFRIECWRSFASYVSGLLREAAASTV